MVSKNDVSIEEYKRIQKELLQIKERLKETEKIAKMGYGELDLISGKAIWSEGFYRILGVDPNNKLDLDVIMKKLVHPDDKDRVIKTMRLAALTGVLDPFEYRVIKEDNTESVFWCKGQIIFDSGGKPIKLVGINQDITHLKQHKTALQENEKRFKYFTEATFEAIFFSEKGICIEQNPAAEVMFGYTLKEAIGRPGTDWIAPESKELVKKI